MPDIWQQLFSKLLLTDSMGNPFQKYMSRKMHKQYERLCF